MVKIQTVDLEGVIYYCGYRVLTKDMKSLGLRKNPNILQYPINEWFYLSDDEISNGAEDWGGIWVARTKSGSNSLVKYMNEKYNIQTKVFKAAIDDILYSNSYRIKTNGIYLLEEI